MVIMKFQTKGMHCPSCEMLVEDDLDEQEGINHTSADHKTGIVEVDFDDQKIDATKIKCIIEQNGFKLIK